VVGVESFPRKHLTHSTRRVVGSFIVLTAFMCYGGMCYRLEAFFVEIIYSTCRVKDIGSCSFQHIYLLDLALEQTK